MEDEDFAWLRKFSTLIVEIDEMFASKEGIEAEDRGKPRKGYGIS